jgi:hypothetical protein
MLGWLSSAKKDLGLRRLSRARAIARPRLCLYYCEEIIHERTATFSVSYHAHKAYIS